MLDQSNCGEDSAGLSAQATLGEQPRLKAAWGGRRALWEEGGGGRGKGGGCPDSFPRLLHIILLLFSSSTFHS